MGQDIDMTSRCMLDRTHKKKASKTQRCLIMAHDASAQIQHATDD